MGQSTKNHQNMKQLVTMSGQIKPTGPPPLGNPAHIKPSSGKVKQSHGSLISQSNIPARISPIDDGGVNRRNDPEEPHGDEEKRSEWPEFSGGERRREESDDGEDAHDGDSGEIDELPVGIALENVVNWGKKGGDDHDSDSDVVDSEQEDI